MSPERLTGSDDLLLGQRRDTRNLLVIASPVAITALGVLAARISIRFFGQWAWAGTAPVYWGSMALVIAVFSGRERLVAWFGRLAAASSGRLWRSWLAYRHFPCSFFPTCSFCAGPSWSCFGLSTA